MKNIKLILRETVPNVGEQGEIVTVKPGFARNFLLPQGLAAEASAANIRKLEQDRHKKEAAAKKEYLEARRRASLLEEVSLTFEARAGEESKLFGSITAADITERLNQQDLGFEIDRRQLDLEEPIKALGVYSVPIRLHADVKPEIKVWVIKGGE